MRAPEPRASQAGLGIAGRFAIVSPARIGLVVFLLGSLASLGQASPSSGQTPAGPVSFVIETIKVEGVRGSSAKIVVSEALLNLGSTYTEAQLREALHRVERLPFVVEADFSLRRGSERGRFELVITVKQTWPVYFGGTLSLARDDGPFGHPEDEAALLPEVGGRVFFGGYHEVSATVRSARFITRHGGDDDPLALDAAYRHHNLFGRHVVGSVFFRRAGPDSREGGAEVAWPLSRASALKAAFTQSRAEWKACAEPCSFEGSESTTSRAGLSWDRDTTDDPFAPRKGSRIGSTLSYSDQSGRLVSDYDLWEPRSDPVTPVTPPSVWTSEFDGDGLDLSLEGLRYWPVLRRASLGLGAKVTVRRVDGRTLYSRGATTRTLEQSGYTVDGSVDAELVGVPGRLGRGGTQVWWVARASAWGYATSLDYAADPPLWFTHATAQSGWARLSLGLAARGRWGIARVELSYQYAFRGRSEVR